MILLDVFGITSHSRYEETQLEWLFGKQAGRFSYTFTYSKYLEMRDDPNHTYFIKTHETPLDDLPAIWVVRDGRNACIGLAHYWDVPVRDTIVGQGCIFGTWSGYYYTWKPEERPDTLILRFEELVKNPDGHANRIGEFIGQKPRKQFDNHFARGQQNYPQLFRKKHADWRSEMTEEERWLFDKVNGDAQRELGYEA